MLSDTFLGFSTEILRSSDLDTVNVRMVRDQLQKETDIVLENYKKPLKLLIGDCYDMVRKEKEDERRESESESDSDEDDANEDDDATPAAPVKKTAANTKSAASKPATATPKKRPKTLKNNENKEEQKKKKKRKAVRDEETLQKNPFTRSMALSPALADVTGETELSRPGVVKALWAYIKTHNLQDPSNKREVLCDDKLKAVFDGQERINCFTMNKYIGKHLSPLPEKDKVE
ncbi:hypothetical protein EC973_002853 [Apophysomyces ossiformis]|uniref:DM2 domain-containing protein n=1 Tax=Apophysomyces ossiformis TaxID=679940 RepID=A0A8H7BS05_9FUNG|nr:hypothetical protein EC973_002853 [Apophysomyces ossiformis]